MVPLSTMKTIFDKCQRDAQSHDGLRKKLIKLFEKRDDLTSFYEDFIRCLNYCLVASERAPSVTMTLDFVSKFVALLYQAPATDNEQESPDEEPEESVFQTRFWEYIIKWHSAASYYIRLHMCELVSRVLVHMGDQAAFDEALYLKLQKAMVERLNDKIVAVRVQAAHALYRLQDNSDPNCVVFAAYQNRLVNESSPEVRLAIITSIHVCKRSLPTILGRTRDVKDTVRKAAYEQLAQKVHVRLIPSAEIGALMKQGLNDRSEMVVTACKEKLLTKWLQQCDNDILKLVKFFDVITDTQVLERMCLVLFESKKPAALVSEFKQLDDSRLIKVNDDDVVEVAFYWRVLCQFIKKGHESRTVDLMTPILPDLPHFCSFIKKHAIESRRVESADEVEELENAFTCLQYLHMTELYDFVDETERSCLHTLIDDLLLSPVTHEMLVPKLAQLLKHSLPNPKNRCGYLLEVIPRIREDLVVVEEALTPSKRRACDMKMAKVRVEINVRLDEKDKAIDGQDFLEAQRLKDVIEELKRELEFLSGQLNPQITETREEKDDEETMWKCLTILCELLMHSECKIDNSTLVALVEHLVLPCIQKEDIPVRLVAVKALGLSCLTVQALAAQHFILFFQICQFDVENIRVVALNAIFDCILLYRFDIFNSPSSEAADEPADNEAEVSASNMPTEIVKMLLVLLDSELSTVRECVALGLCKLLFVNRIMSTKIYSRLLIMWFNPVNGDESFLKNMLGVFLQAYAHVNKENRDVVCQALLPILRVLTKAPKKSPLRGINVDHVIHFILDLVEPIAKEKTSLHNKIAAQFCEEIQKDDQSELAEILVKNLGRLKLKDDRYRNLKVLDTLCKEILEEMSDRTHRSKVRLFQGVVLKLVEQVGYSSSGGENSGDDSDDTEPEQEAEAPAVSPSRSGQQQVGDGVADSDDAVLSEATLDSGEVRVVPETTDDESMLSSEDDSHKSR